MKKNVTVVRKEGREEVRITITFYRYELPSRFIVTIYRHVLPSLYGVSSFVMSSLGSSSIFAKANHFLPRSFNEAPI